MSVGHANRARRLAEEAVRLSPPGRDVAARVKTLDAALREGGFVKEALRLRRTYLESVGDEAERVAALRVLAERGDRRGPGEAGGELAPRRGGRRRCRPSRASPNPRRRPIIIWPRSGCWHAATTIRRRVLALLEKALARHPGADAALALAEKLMVRVVGRRGLLAPPARISCAPRTPTNTNLRAAPDSGGGSPRSWSRSGM